MPKKMRTTRNLLLMATLLGSTLFANAAEKEMTKRVSINMSRHIWLAIRWNLVKNWVTLPPIILLLTKLTSRKLLSSIAKPLKFVCNDVKGLKKY